MPKAVLLLGDGTRWEGAAVGAPGVAVGALTVFTGMADYMRVLTDPACAGQIVCMTYPSIGNYGVNTENGETGRPWLKGLVVHELCETPSNWRSVETVGYFLRRNLVTGISGLDTRALTRHLRAHGPQNAAICATPGFSGWDALLMQTRAYQPEHAYPAAVRAPESFHAVGDPFCHVAVCDFGSSRALARLLAEMGLRVTLLPPDKALGLAAAGGYDGLILAHGAGVPQKKTAFVKELSGLIDSELPILGLGLGFLYLAQAAGARLTPMPLGHRGSNQPVLDRRTGRTAVTRQDHGLTVDPDSINPDVAEVSHVNGNDCSVEGLRFVNKPVLGVQYVPTALTVTDGGLVFAEFIDAIFASKGGL